MGISEAAGTCYTSTMFVNLETYSGVQHDQPDVFGLQRDDTAGPRGPRRDDAVLRCRIR
ncbi:hypothetical protein MTBSS4_120154 [Magnetospirillum sp. SS-4]|nr:hypothetical protein MTBSS4_120154 [Magnetospirillum sp. SS-4]